LQCILRWDARVAAAGLSTETEDHRSEVLDAKFES
jgi:hypothetical protein